MNFHFHDHSSLGAVGSGVTIGAGLLTHLVSMTPQLQAISLVVSITVGVLTAAWYVRRFFTGK